MVRMTMIAALCLTTASAAVAQGTIDESLRDVRVFDCALGDSQAIYIFRADAEGGISLVGDADTAVRATENGLSVMTADGLQEISDGAYHVYKSGNAESGTCNDVTDFALALYGPLTAAYAPEATGQTVAEQAAAASLADLTVRMQRAEADMVTTKAQFDDLTAAKVAAEAALQEATAELKALRPKVETQSNELAAATAKVDDLTVKLAETEAALSVSQADLDAATGELAETKTALETLQTQYAELDAAIGALTTERDTLAAELAELRALHDSVTAAATGFQGQLTETTAKLKATDADNRSLVATVSGLNGKISELGAELRKVRGERDAALKKAAGANSSRVSTSALTTAAIRQLATMQGRSQNAIRSELCRLIGGSSGC